MKLGVDYNKREAIIFWIAVFAFWIIPTLSSLAYEFPLTGRLREDGEVYADSIASMRFAIITASGTIVWNSDDGGSDYPSQNVNVSINDSGQFYVSIGDTDIMEPITMSVLQNSEKLYLMMWINDEQLSSSILIPTNPKAIYSQNSAMLGGVDASDYTTSDEVSALISSSGSASTATTNFVVGTGQDVDQKITMNLDGSSDPFLLYDVSESVWKLSNDGSTSTEMATQGAAIANRFVGTGSTTLAVDLATAEVSGTLPVSKGGTSATTASGARTALGLQIGVDVMAYDANAAFQKSNLTATSAPTVNNDSSESYGVGSRWIDTTNDKAYVALDVSVGAAVWTETTAGTNFTENIVFEGASADDYETTLQVVDPTADRTITLPNSSGTVALTTDISSQNLFQTINAPAGTDPVADSTTDTLNLITGSSNITITGASGSDTITFDIADSYLLNNGDTGTGNYDLTGAILLGASPLAFEGATDDDYQITLAVEDPDADRTITLPNTTGTVALTSSNITGNADTATALAANGSNCSSGNYPLGVDASGAAESCTADDDTPDDDSEVPNDITIASTSQSQSFTFGTGNNLTLDANSTATTATNGIIDMNVLAGDAAVDGMNITYAVQNGASTGVDFEAIVLSLSANDADADLFGINITAAATALAAAGSYEAAITIDNAENTSASMTDGILITSSGTDGGVVDAIDVSASNITNAINIGNNPIVTGNVAGTIGDGTTDSWTLTTDGTGNGEVVLPDDSIGTAEILDNTITATNLSATITMAAGDIIDMSSSTNDGKGLRLPQGSTDSPTNSGNTEGLIYWDTDDDVLKVHDGSSSWISINTATGANTALSNLSSVAINTSLISDTANTDDLGTEAIFWRKAYLGSEISFEGTSDDTYQTTLVVANTTSSDKTITLPDETGTVALTSSSITGNAATATALAANGGNCSSGNYPLGVDASGAVESCTADDDTPDDDSEVPNDITVNSSNAITTTATNGAGASGNPLDVTSSLGIMDGSDDYTGLDINLTNADHTGSSNTVQAIDISGITADAQATEIAINVATGWDIGLDLQQNTLAFEETGGGSDDINVQPPASVSGDITVTLPASSGTIALTSGNISGNAATATALAANGGNCTSGNYPLGVDASGAAESCTADDDTPDDDSEVPNDVTIASSGKSHSFTFGASDELTVDATSTATTTTAGVIDLNIGAGNAAVDGINLGLTMNDGAGSGTDFEALVMTLTADDADGDMFGLVISGAATANAAAGSYEAGISIDNAENTSASMTDGILITSSGASGGVVDAIDVSASNITNAINIGDNPIVTGNVAGTIGDATTDSWTLTTDGTGNGEVVLPDDSIGTDEILDNTITATNLSATITTAAGDIIDMSSSTNDGKGLRLPQGSTDSPTNSGNTEGLIYWDTDDDTLKVHDGSSSWISINTAAGANTALSNLSSVAINTSLISDTANTDDLGTEAIFWRKAYLASEISFEGSSDDDYQTTLVAANTTSSDKTITLPDETGTVALTSSSITGNAATATALAANGANCSSGNYPLGVDASGAAESCTADDDTPDDDSEVPNDITVNSSNAITTTATNGAGASGNPLDVTSSLGIMDGSDDYTGLDINLTNANHTGSSNTVQAIDISGITADAQATEIAINVATGWDIGLDLQQNTLAFEETGGGSDNINIQPPSAVSGDITLTLPSSAGTIALTSDNISGNAATATALAANGGNCTSGNYPLGVDASGAAESCTADDDTPDSDGEVPDDITIASSAKSHSFTFGASDELTIDATSTANTTTAGVIDLNIGAGNAAVDGINLGLTMNDGAGSGTNFEGLVMTLTADDADGDMFGIVLSGAATANAAAGSYEAGIFIDNAENTSASMTDGILITSSGASGGVVDAIDVSASNITNAINIGDNPIVTGNVAGTIGDATTDSWTLTTDGTGNGEVVLPDDSIGTDEILDNTITATNLSATITTAAGDIIDMSSSTNDGKGLRLPQGSTDSPTNSGNTEGLIYWDTDDDILKVHDGTSSWVSINGAASGANAALSNLSSVAINASLISDTANTDDLGTEAIFWRKAYLASEISFEGSSDDDYQTTLVAANTTSSDKTITLPDETGTVALTSSSITGNAATATALAANGANCSSGNYPLGVDASGAAESCTADDDAPDDDSEVPNDITVNSSNAITTTATNGAGASGNPLDVTSSLGIMDGSDDYTGLDINLTNADHTGSSNTVQAIDISGITADAQATEIAINVATGWDIGLDLQQNTLAFEETGGGSDNINIQPPSAVSGDITLTLPSSAGTIALTSDNISGNAATATALAANGGNCTSGNYPLGVDASGAAESCTADDDTPDDDSEVPNDITIASSAKSHSFTFGASDELTIDATSTANTTTAGVIDLNIGAGNAAVDGINVGLTMNDGASSGTDFEALVMTLTADDADGDMFGIVLSGAATANAAAGSYEAGIFIDNAENTSASMTDGILITSSGASGGVVDAIDVSAANITNAINIGDNPIVTGNVAGTIGDATTDSWTFTTDGTGNGEIVLPDGSIGSDEILNGAVDISDDTNLVAGTNITLSGDTLNVDDAFLSNSGDTGTGAYNFGGATDFEIPNGADPSVNVAGEVSVDTSSGDGSMIRFYGDAERALPAYQSKSFIIASPETTDDFPVWKTPHAITIREIHGVVQGGTNVVFGLDECDGNGDNNAAIDSDITATTSNTNDDGSLSNAGVDADDYICIHITSVSGSVDFLTVTFEYTIDPTN